MEGSLAGNVVDKQRKLDQVWTERNKFFCGGRLVFGPDVSPLFLTTFLIAGPAIAFCIKTYLKIKKASDHDHWYPVLIVGSILTVMDLIFLLLTSGTDPGILPKNSRLPEFDPSMEWISDITSLLKVRRTKDVIFNGHTVKVKFCDTCSLYRLPSTFHCSKCNNCVQGLDHHCAFVGKCIGIRNYRYFMMLVSTSTILCIYIFVFSCISIAQNNVWKTITHDYVSDFLIIYCLFTVWFVGAITAFKLYDICTKKRNHDYIAEDQQLFDNLEEEENEGIF